MVLVRPRCFFDIDIDGQRVGRIVFELFSDEVPKTAENFRALCTGEKGISSISKVPLHYRGSVFHRVIKGFMVQGGDFTRRNGTGGESIYGSNFPDESLTRPHDEPFLLSMANRGPNTQSSQFFITVRPAPHLDGKHVVFGRVVSGENVVREIENVVVDQQDRPVKNVMVANCGELVLVKPQGTANDAARMAKKREGTESGSESEESMDERKKKQHKKRKKKSKKKRKHRSGSPAYSGSESESEEERRRRKKKKKKSKKKKHRKERDERRPRGKESESEGERGRSRTRKSRSRSRSLTLSRSRSSSRECSASPRKATQSRHQNQARSDSRSRSRSRSIVSAIRSPAPRSPSESSPPPPNESRKVTSPGRNGNEKISRGRRFSRSPHKYVEERIVHVRGERYKIEAPEWEIDRGYKTSEKEVKVRGRGRVRYRPRW
ncbi:uncharacterized protein VTP21DRAFT_11318 [Calcarisporiella thermophila]|uniref:uncharacterized protein n=1 Tax=Calcarisporiella thermophila TaxID=911321 RepID=UPI0037420024